ncbi:MAG: hypothetical protein JW982_03385 [Spirochaetes bacterium]|nr:hypothetical protein [Spirochaetota bacterium]
MKTKRKFIISVIITIVLTAAVTVYLSFPSVPGMFKLNQQLQEQGYYMAEFEFKMVAIAYYLDKGRYYTALSMLHKLNKQLETREGLIKVPEFKNKNEEMEFYLNRQNPRTGAFMDDSYPFFTFISPTGNILNHLDALAQQTGQPLKLKYPLRFLDEVNTPEKLNNFLNEITEVGWLGNKFPQTTFHFTRCLLSLFYEDPIIEKYDLYEVSPEWKTALLKWFYDHQDPESGIWGPRSKSGKLLRIDTSNSAKIIKAFVDDDGNDRFKDFPLNYRDQIAASFLNQSFDNIPEDSDLDEWHEWSLNTPKSLRTLTRYLWSGLSEEMKAKAKEQIEYFIRIKFEKFYIADEGSFSYYPGAEHATIEGSGIITDFDNYGLCSEKNRIRLWGDPEKNCTDLGSFKVKRITETDLKMIANAAKVNSIRFYATNPGTGFYTEKALGVFYPEKTAVLDVMDFIPKMKIWISDTSQIMGNWTSREDIRQRLSEINIKPVPVLKEELPLNELNSVLLKNHKLILVGFDILQVPVYIINFELQD